MKYLRKHTNIPIPEIIAHETADNNPTGLGPFIIMSWIDGVKMKDLLTTETERYLLNPDLHEMTLKRLYYENFQTRRLVPDYASASNVYSSSVDYFANLAKLHFLHLKEQLNSVDDSRDCLEKYTCRHLLRSIIPIFASTGDGTGPFKLFCDDFGPGNILVDPGTLKITGVIDWEFTYAAPAQFSSSPPEWLVINNIAHWCLEAYGPIFDLFIRVLEEKESEAESKRSHGGTKDAICSTNDSCGGDEKLSKRMRQSLEDRTVWFNLAMETMSGLSTRDQRRMKNQKKKMKDD
ncbi:hypothetical protein FQN57_001863 [Myotisia sp. PD_48]|nr:hypothetical protein FQN57_001863 [Myotisia sp. PD_48]